MLVLFTDTDTDLTPKTAEKYGYHLISMPYAIDGKETYPYEDFDEFDPHAFYDKLRGGVLPTTAAIPTQRYIDYFEPFLKNGDDILYVHFSRNMTATFDNMDKALEQLKQKYPDRTVADHRIGDRRSVPRGQDHRRDHGMVKDRDRALCLLLLRG